MDWKGSASLTQALKSYNEAEKHLKRPNADLHFNRARVLEYLLEVDGATKEFQRSFEIDPVLGGDREADRLSQSLLKAYKATTSKVG